MTTRAGRRQHGKADPTWIPGVAWRMADIRLEAMEFVFGLNGRCVVRRPLTLERIRQVIADSHPGLHA